MGCHRRGGRACETRHRAEGGAGGSAGTVNAGRGIKAAPAADRRAQSTPTRDQRRPTRAATQALWWSNKPREARRNARHGRRRVSRFDRCARSIAGTRARRRNPNQTPRGVLHHGVARGGCLRNRGGGRAREQCSNSPPQRRRARRAELRDVARRRRLAVAAAGARLGRREAAGLGGRLVGRRARDRARRLIEAERVSARLRSARREKGRTSSSTWVAPREGEGRHHRRRRRATDRARGVTSHTQNDTARTSRTHTRRTPPPPPRATNLSTVR